MLVEDSENDGSVALAKLLMAVLTSQYIFMTNS
jgi:hypothetical protein